MWYKQNNNNVFYLNLNGSIFDKNNILMTTNGIKVKVLKYIKNNRWNWFLRWLGFNIRIGSHKVELLQTYGI